MWSGRNPGQGISEQRVADQALSLLRRNAFTSVELQYLQQQTSNQSDLSTNPTLSSAESFSGVLSNSSAGTQTQNDASHPDCVAATCLTKGQMDLKETLLIYMKETAQLLDKKERLPSLKSIPMSVLKMHTQAVNDLLCYIEVLTIQEVIL